MHDTHNGIGLALPQMPNSSDNSVVRTRWNTASAHLWYLHLLSLIKSATNLECRSESAKEQKMPTENTFQCTDDDILSSSRHRRKGCTNVPHYAPCTIVHYLKYKQIWYLQFFSYYALKKCPQHWVWGDKLFNVIRWSASYANRWRSAAYHGEKNRSQKRYPDFPTKISEPLISILPFSTRKKS